MVSSPRSLSRTTSASSSLRPVPTLRQRRSSSSSISSSSSKSMRNRSGGNRGGTIGTNLVH